MRDNLREALEKQPPAPLGERPKYYNGLLYGPFGVGKTKEAAECVENKGLIIYTDNGWETLHNHPYLLDKFHGMEYDGLSQLEAVGDAIKEGEKIGDIDYGALDLVMVDTVGGAQDDYIDFLMDNYSFSGDSRTKATPTSSGKKAGLQPLEITGLTDYHMVRNKMRHPLRSLIKAPCNVIFITHLREPNFMEQAKGKMLRRPNVTEAVYMTLARDMSWMGLMTQDDKKKRTIQFQVDRKTAAKSRIQELNDQTINAEDLSVILKKWRNK